MPGLLRSWIGTALRRARAASGTSGATDPLVTEADIVAAYRLLLGRAPDPDGLRTFRAMVGAAPPSALSGALLASEEFRRTPMHAALARREHEDLAEADIGDGLRLLVSPHDLSNRGLLDGGAYEPHVAAALDAALSPGMSVCVVGANVGHHVLRAARRVGETGRVVAFEARPRNAQLVARNVARNGLRNVTVVPLAVADERTLLHYVAAQGTNGAVAKSEAGAVPGTDPDDVLVQAVPLDDLRSLLGDVDVLQMDVEGAEGLVVRGARELLAASRPTLFAELSLGQLERTSHMTGEAMLGALRDLGYAISVLRFDGRVESFGQDVDAVCAYARAQAAPHVDVRCDPAHPAATPRGARGGG